MTEINHREKLQAALNDLRTAVKNRIDLDEEDIQNFLFYFNGQEDMVTETLDITLNAKFNQYYSGLQILKSRANDFNIKTDDCLNPAKEILNTHSERITKVIKEKLKEDVSAVKELYQGYQAKSNAILVDIESEITTMEEKLSELDAEYVKEALPVIGQSINNLPEQMANTYEGIKNQVHEKGEKMAKYIDDAMLEVEILGSLTVADAKKCVYTLIREHQNNKKKE